MSLPEIPVAARYHHGASPRARRIPDNGKAHVVTGKKILNVDPASGAESAVIMPP
jgi:hypothetical protein